MTVSWEFTVDTLTAPNFNTQLPLVIGTLSVSDDIWFSGSLSYSYQRVDCALFVNCRIVQSGQIDGWSLDLGPNLDLPTKIILDLDGSASLSFDPLGNFSGSIVQHGFESDMSMTINSDVASGQVASDYTVFGCKFLGRCDYTGHWALAEGDPVPVAAIPEPTMGLVFIAAATLARWRHR